MTEFSRKRRRWIAAVACVPLLVPSACGSAAGAGIGPQGPTITVGVSSDRPGLGYRHDEEYVGFDIDVAEYVAEKLGYARKQVVFSPLDPADAVPALDGGDVDMVVAGLSMDAGLAEEATFAGPYLVSRPALMVRAADADDMKADRTLAGETVCVVAGTGMKESVERGTQATTVEHDSYAQCLTALMVGSASAVAGDDATLHGLRSGRREDYAVLADENGRLGQGIAVKAGRTGMARKIAAALREMIHDGSWESSIESELGSPYGYESPEAPDPAEITMP